jgi:excisionase family DNA binding protein
MPPPSEDERLTVSEVAEDLGISPKTVRRIIDRGELVAYQLTARKTYVLRRDLSAFIESRPRVAATGRR